MREYRAFSTAITVIGLCIFGLIICMPKPEYKPPNHTIRHEYDYIIHSDCMDSMPILIVYDYKHKYIGKCTSDKLEELIIQDNY